MPVRLDIARTDLHFEQILQLQRRYHASSVAPEQHASQGFVFAEHTPALLQSMARELPQVIAVCDERVIGYTLAMPTSMRDAVPSLVPMFEQFDACVFRGKALADYAYFVGGQVCVDAAFRGQGLIGRLYAEAGRRLASRFELCVTEVSQRNEVSLRAHRKIGFEELSRYHDGRENWQVIAWNLTSATADSDAAIAHNR